MLRAALLYLSERRDLRDWLLRRRSARDLALRFVAGETLEAALGVCRAVNARGMRVSLDYLGESVTPEEAEGAVAAYVRALDRVAAEGVRSSVSLKLTQLGLDIDERLCAENLERIVARAAELGIFVRIDMEQSEYVDATLRLFRGLFPRYRNLGAVIQSVLRRSEADVRALCEMRAPVRLVKGAYKEPEAVAFQKKKEVDASYATLLGILVGCGCPLAVATHDVRMIGRAKALRRARPERAAARNPGRDPFGNPPFEFQMLYGVRRDLQEALVREGYEMRIYVPYGTQWYAYLLRRLAERPANLWFMVRAVLGERFRRSR